MKRQYIALIFFFSIFNSSANTPEEILSGTSLFGNASCIVMKVSMEIHTDNGIKNRGLEVFIKRDEESSRILLHIISPAFLNKMKFLSCKDPDGNEYKWLKTSRGVKKLSGANRNNRLFDSDFTAEDFSEINFSDFELSILKPEKIASFFCDTVEVVPESGKHDYNKKIIYIEKVTGVLAGVDFFNEQGNIIKKYYVINTQNIDGNTFPLTSKMISVETNTYTILKFDSIKIKDSIPDRVFNKGSL